MLSIFIYTFKQTILEALGNGFYILSLTIYVNLSEDVN